MAVKKSTRMLSPWLMVQKLLTSRLLMRQLRKLLPFSLLVLRLLLRLVPLARKKRQGELGLVNKVRTLVVLTFTGTLPLLWYLVRTTDLQIVCPYQAPNSTAMCSHSFMFSFIFVRLYLFVGMQYTPWPVNSAKNASQSCRRRTNNTPCDRHVSPCTEGGASSSFGQ
jgi:hypothetical protein